MCVRVVEEMPCEDQDKLEREIARGRAYLAGSLKRAPFHIDAWEALIREGRYAKAWRLARRNVCGARRKRDEQPCLMEPVPGKRRCKFHGGMSTGARTAEGRERRRQAAVRRWARWRAERETPEIDIFS